MVLDLDVKITANEVYSNYPVFSEIPVEVLSRFKSGELESFFLEKSNLEGNVEKLLDSLDSINHGQETYARKPQNLETALKQNLFKKYPTIFEIPDSLLESQYLKEIVLFYKEDFQKKLKEPAEITIDLRNLKQDTQCFQTIAANNSIRNMPLDRVHGTSVFLKTNVETKRDFLKDYPTSSCFEGKCVYNIAIKDAEEYNTALIGVTVTRGELSLNIVSKTQLSFPKTQFTNPPSVCVKPLELTIPNPKKQQSK